MKKLIPLTLALVMILSLCSCSSSSSVQIPEVSLLINDSKEDTTTDIATFPTYYARESAAYIHYYVTSDQPEEPIRIKIESQWGRDDRTEEDFVVESDEIIPSPTNQWNYVRLDVGASNLYFYRVTLYYGEENAVLATKTIYTPYEKASYDTFESVEPPFHPINALTDEEQALYDICQYTVLDYATINHYGKIDNLTAWQSETSLYLCVQYKNPSEMIWFNINMDDPEDYVAHFDSDGIIPAGEGTAQQNVLDNYYYIILALDNALNQV